MTCHLSILSINLVVTISEIIRNELILIIVIAQFCTSVCMCEINTQILPDTLVQFSNFTTHRRNHSSCYCIDVVLHHAKSTSLSPFAGNLPVPFRILTLPSYQSHSISFNSVPLQFIFATRSILPFVYETGNANYSQIEILLGKKEGKPCSQFISKMRHYIFKVWNSP